jgi:hypothetical protein
MRHSSLLSFLNGEKSADELWQEIEAEVTNCLTATSKGEVGHVIITDGPETLITREYAEVLLRAFAEGSLPMKAASYIADAMIMSDDFDFADDEVTEALFYFSDESRPPSLQDIAALRRRLSAAPA